MSHVINSVSKVAATSNYLNLPITAGIDRMGFWYEYKPVNVNNDTLGASVVPYRWGNILTMPSSATEMTIDGTLALITEPWDGGNVKYHNGTIVHIGSGVNDITAAQESDALFFGHLGSLSPATDDNAFYWDRMYLPVGSSEWLFYQYHKHLPTFYPKYENGRATLAAVDYISPSDKAYGYLIQLNIKVGATSYQSVLLRVHTPSVGGAHNSHNDITLPSVNAKNYQVGGVIKGSGDKFHAFYIAANGSLWDIFTRTYVHASASCTTEVLLATVDLADPTIIPTDLTGSNYNYPIRASAGEFLNGYIYIPVILNNATSGFDLEIWELESSNSLTPSSLTRYTILTGETVRPDCHLTVFNDQIHLITTKPSVNGISFYAYENESWAEATTTLLTNGSNPIRIHGFRYNSEEIYYYMLLSGTSSGTGTYTGPGLYKFDLVGDFAGYYHLDYNESSHEFKVRAPLTAGHIYYSSTDYNLVSKDTVEPQGIAFGSHILTINKPSPQFYDPHVLSIDDAYVYQAKRLKDNRKLLVGAVERPYGDIEQSDLFISLVSQDNSIEYNFYYEGTDNGYKGGNDYITGLYQSEIDSNKVWITGYTKSELVERKDIRIHGYCRRFTDNPNYLSHVDIVNDSNNNILILNNDATSGVGYLVKYDNNYNLVWQMLLYADPEFITFTKLTIDSNDNLYATGSISNNSTVIVKVNSSGALVWNYQYTQSSGTDTATGIQIIDTGSTELLMLSIVNGTTTTFVTLDTDGVIVEQNKVNDLVVNRIRSSQSETNRLLFAGYKLTYTGETYTITAQSTSNYYWNGGIYTNALDPSPVTLYRNATYTFIINAAGHPFWIKTAQTTGTSNAYNDGVTNNGTASGTITFTVPEDAPNTLYYNCEFHTNMSGAFAITDNPETGKFGMCELESNVPAVKWVTEFGSTCTDIANIDSASPQGYIIVGTNSSDASILKVNVTESGGSFTVAKSWARTLSGSTFKSVVVSPYTETTRYIYAVGDIASSGLTDMGMGDGLVAGYDNTGTLLWQNAFGHDMMESFTSVCFDMYNRNLLITGWSRSHSYAQDGVFFRCDTNGFGTGRYHPPGNPGMPYFYVKSNQVSATNSNSITNLTAPANSSGSIVKSAFDVFSNSSNISNERYDGSYGTDGVFGLFFGYIELDKIQQYLNTYAYKERVSQGYNIHPANSFLTLWQVHTVGDGTADDGNCFGYDIIEASTGVVYVAGQTSGDVAKTNGGASGVYDILGIEFFPTAYGSHLAGDISYYQAGDTYDEEIYACVELANGKIAFCGRTAGDIGGTNYGGYDILIGIYDPSDDSITWNQYGSGLNDRGFNLHDVGNNTLAVVFETSGDIGASTHIGAEDIGVIFYNYVTETWGNAYQVGTTASDILNTLGKPSTLMGDGRIAIAFSTSGNFNSDDPNSSNKGFLDLALAIFDPLTMTWQKAQIGTQASERINSVGAKGNNLFIAGYIPESFDGGARSIFIEADASAVIKGITSV